MHTIPTNYTEAINSEYWVSTMQKEFDSLVKNNTFKWQKSPKDENIVGSRWVYTLKYKQDRIYEYKARFVAKGYLKIHGKDYRETFTQTTNMASIRLLQVAVQYDLLIHHMDVKRAYSNAPLDYKIYVDLPKGFEGKKWELCLET